MRLRDRHKAETRALVLEAAAALFAAQGYEATTTRQVAQRAGVATGTVFAHFPDKAALVAALLHEHIERALTEAFATLPEGDLVRRLVHVAATLYAAYDARPDLSRAMLQATLFQAGGEPDRPAASSRASELATGSASGDGRRGGAPGRGGSAVPDGASDAGKDRADPGVHARGGEGPLGQQLRAFEGWVQGELARAVAGGEIPDTPLTVVFVAFFTQYFGLLVGGLRGELPPEARPAMLEALLRRSLGMPA